MSLVRKNIIANLVGSGWVALISVAFIPLYIHFMGVESYGLVGFYLTLQALFAVLDMGLTATVSRELARLSALKNKEQEMRNLVRTLEIVYWAIAILVVISVTLLAPWIATNWLNASELSVDTVRLSIILMGIMVALRMPYGFYSGGLLGLQRQVKLNLVKIVVETIRSGGAVLVLWQVSSSIISFFMWQLIISGLGLCLIAVVLWKQMPDGASARFQPSIFYDIWRFTAGMSSISILAVILIQSDKFVLSKMLSLEAFAYYVLASTVAMGLTVIISPIFSAMYPRFTQLVANKDERILIALYHKSCQFMTVLVMPVALVICFFSENILRIWTQELDLSSQTAPILSILIIGTALNGMMSLPFAIQLAHEWTRLAISMNMISIIILLPALIITVESYGTIGAAVIWLVLNICYIIFGLAIMHKKIFKGELKHWIMTDFGLPSLASIGVIVCFWIVFPRGLSEISQLLWFMLTVIVAWGISAWTAPAIRHDLINRVNTRKVS